MSQSTARPARPAAPAVCVLATGLGLCSALAAAETTLYGGVRLGLDYVDVKTTGQSNWDVINETSRFGTKGSEDLGGLTTIWQFEFGVPADGSGSAAITKRLSWVGLKGSLGTVAIGRQWTPYFLATSLDDVFNSDDTSVSYYFLGLPHRWDDMISYTSPDWGGFSLAGAFVLNGAGNGLDGAQARQDGVDAWDIAAIYRQGPLVLGAAYQRYESAGVDGNTQFPAGSAQWGLAASYRFGDVNLIGAWHQAHINDARDSKPSVYGLTGEYFIGPTHVVRAGYGHYDPDAASGKDYDQYKLGYQYNFSKRTRTWIEYSHFDYRSPGAKVAAIGQEYDNVQIGIRHDF